MRASRAGRSASGTEEVVVSGGGGRGVDLGFFDGFEVVVVGLELELDLDLREDLRTGCSLPFGFPFLL